MASKSYRPTSRIEALVWIALIVFIGYRIWPQGAAAFGFNSENAPVPSFQLTALDGSSLSSESLRGKVVLVNFWATWCPPCRFEMPGFQAVYDSRKGRGFIVLGITTDGDRDLIDRFLAEHHITYPIAMASGSVVQSFGGVSVLPTSFLIDRNGRIRNEVRGVFASVALRSAVDHLLAEPPPAAAPSAGARSSR
jgi:peroxiredoxin